MVERAIAILDSELEIIKMELEHREVFAAATTPEAPDFDLHFEGKSKEFGIVGLAEVVFALFLTEEIVGKDKKPVSLVRLANAFEYYLDMNFGSIYKQVEAILFNRKSFNRTKALDYLRALILREEKRRENEKAKKQNEK
jgi:hypothetical protein